ncbi:hypothetical protein [Caballeronia mineralivorans]|uniref:hypothetical protein n=1 Tax=Caballeronia mineralivorans TaxID=2010198 RepID=UPI0023F1E481|nr:hypothetical protein [Caballeronia mineralivorans]
MRIALAIITALSYFGGFFTMVGGDPGHQTVFQEMTSGISFVCGTVALVGVGIIHQLVGIKARLPEPRPTFQPSEEIRA